jgi:hypothetical protein
MFFLALAKSLSMEVPFIFIFHPSFFTRFVKIEIIVVFPAPFCHKSAKKSPDSISRSIFLRTLFSQ